MSRAEDRDKKEKIIFDNLVAKLPELIELKKELDSNYLFEDMFYRFYYQSFKVYGLQGVTTNIVKLLREISVTNTDRLNEFFEEIIAAGTGIKFDMDHNQEWTKHTRPIVEAYFHAARWIDVLIDVAQKPFPPKGEAISSGFAAFLCLYNARF